GVAVPAVDYQLHLAGGRRAAERDLSDRMAAVLPAIRLLPGGAGRVPRGRGAARGAALRRAGRAAGSVSDRLRAAPADERARGVVLGTRVASRRDLARGAFFAAARRSPAGHSAGARGGPAERAASAGDDRRDRRAAVRAGERAHS